MIKATEMVGGALVSEALKVVIETIKKVKSFKPLFEALKLSMETLLPIVEKIEALQKQRDPTVNELNELRETIERAEIVIQKCSRVRWFYFLNMNKYAGEIVEVNTKIQNFCQTNLQLLQYRNQLESMEANAENFEIVKDMISVVSDSKAVYRYLCLVPPLKVVPVGFDQPFRELKKKLLDKDSVDSLLVSAPGGCGKTTLVTQLCHDQEVKGEFKENIFFNVVSSAPDFKVLVQNLLQHNGRPPYEFQNDSQAIVGLEILLKELRKAGPILLVLDDVWQGVESLLQKFPTNIPDLKILVTSRSAFPSFSSRFELSPLGDKDAEALFLKFAFGPEHTTTPPKYEHILPKILKGCCGFPIVIEVVGATLKGKPLSSWKGQVESWSEGKTILDSSDEVMDRLRPSFDALKPDLKECFMDMGSFLEDQKIRASVIIDICVGLYGEGSDMYMSNLNDLASQNLLKVFPLGGHEPEDGFYNEFLVTQHDILRDLAICQSKSEGKKLNLVIRGDNIPDWCLDPMHSITARLLSISTRTTDDLFSSKCVAMKCPEVEVLVLNLFSSDYALPNCIDTMKKLKAVIIINHGANPAKLTNVSCLSELPNLKRIRLEKVLITLLDILELQLQGLKKLSLVMCSFGKISHDAKGIEVSKALPSLQEIDIDYCYDLVELPNWVSEVVSLKTLSITNCNKLPKLPEAIGNLSKVEVLRLTSCISLSELPETTDKLSNLRLLDISGCLDLKKLPLEIGNLQKLEKILMRKCSEIELPDSVTKLENLEVKCDEESAFLWRRLKPKMRSLTVTEEETEHNLNLLRMY